MLLELRDLEDQGSEGYEVRETEKGFWDFWLDLGGWTVAVLIRLQKGLAS